MGVLQRGGAAALAAALLACGGDGRTPVVVYSPHGRVQLQALEQAFERRHPDLDVRWLDLGSQEVLDRLRFERVNPQCDVWFGGPTTIFDRGLRDTLLQPSRPSWAAAVPGGAGPEGRYWSLYRTPAVIAWNAKVVAASDAPHDWDEILDARWFDKVLIRDPVASGTMRAIWGYIIERSIAATGDTTAAMAWLRRLDRNTKTYALNPAILDEKLARAEGLLTLWDLPDILISMNRGYPFGWRFPASGTVVIDDAIGMVQGAPHPQAAQRFIDFVGESEGLLIAARRAYRLPARLDLPADSMPPWYAEVVRTMRVAPMDWAMLARDGSGWMAYWDAHVRHTGRRPS